MPTLANQFGITYKNFTFSGLNSFSFNFTDADIRTLTGYIARNAAKLYVYFEDKTETVVAEEEKYTTSGILSSIGGAISLYLGFSFISLVEVLEIPIRMCRPAAAAADAKRRSRSEKRSAAARF